MSFHRFSEQKSIWNLSVKQLILLALFGSSVHAIQAFKKALPKQSFCNAWWTWFVQTALVATECGAARRILKRRATLLAGVTQSVRSNLGFKVIAHDLILDLYLKKSLRLFWVGFCYSAQHPRVKTRYRADLIPACLPKWSTALHRLCACSSRRWTSVDLSTLEHVQGLGLVQAEFEATNLMMTSKTLQVECSIKVLGTELFHHRTS